MEIVWFLGLTFLGTLSGAYLGYLMDMSRRKKSGAAPVSFWSGKPKSVGFEEPVWGVVLEVSMVVYAKDRESAIEEAYSQVINPNQKFLTASLVDLYSIEEDMETS